MLLNQTFLLIGYPQVLELFGKLTHALGQASSSPPRAFITLQSRTSLIWSSFDTLLAFTAGNRTQWFDNDNVVCRVLHLTKIRRVNTMYLQ